MRHPEEPAFAQIAVSGVPFSADRPYDYAVPVSLRERICPGARVWVPFGQGNRKTEGFVLRLTETSQVSRLKPVAALIDDPPLLSENAVSLALWMRSRYFCTCFEALRVMLPTGFWYTQTELITLTPDQDHDEALLLLKRAPAALALYETLWQAGGTLNRTALAERLDGADLNGALQTLSQHGLVQKELITRRQTGDKTQRHAALLISGEEALQLAEQKKSRSPAQAALLTLLAQLGEASVRELCYFTGASAQSVTVLAKKGLVELFEVKTPPAVPQIQAGPPLCFALSASQIQVVDTLLKTAQTGAPACALLTGVTGSGKTAVYIELTRKILETGGTALIMVPEIVLTPQLREKFGGAFGSRVALLHSGLSVRERMDEWRRLRSGEATVALGTRSAVFAPLEDLKLIILDEEQESSYKSESAPRYHAREVAQYRLSKTGGLLLLGSATPSLESAWHAQSGRYGSLKLTERFNAQPLPEVLMADRRADLLEGNDTGLGRVLAGELRRNLDDGRQSILFLNRRGYNRYYVCERCGQAPGCPRCSVSLTYHAANGRLMCHYCGHSEPVRVRCADCDVPLHPIGTGTQRIEEALLTLFPGIEVLRMDADTTAGRGTHEKQLRRFSEGKIPILIGTQMVTRGLDFENVTLVGVLDADMALGISDFRAHERAFSLIAQVVGRAGRGRYAGRAVLQTFAPDDPVLRAAARQDYGAFFAQELALRKAAKLPPFCDILRLTFSGVFQDAVRAAARRGRQHMDAWPGGLRLLGPAPAFVLKMGGRYRYQITLLGEISADIRARAAHLLHLHSQDRQNTGVSLSADLNPYD